jgi:hypothetical protein
VGEQMRLKKLLLDDPVERFKRLTGTGMYCGSIRINICTMILIN